MLLAGDLEVAAELEQPVHVRRVVGGREPQGVVRELGGSLRRAPPRRGGGPGRDRRRERGIRLLGGKGEVADPELTVRDGVGDDAVEPTPLGSRAVPDRGSGDQRVRRAQVGAVDDDHAGFDGGLERAVVGQLPQPIETEVGAQGDGGEQPARRARQSGHAGPEQLLDPLGDGKLSPERRHAVDDERASHLEREQRVAQRRLEDPPHHRTREAEPEPLEEETAHPSQAQAAELEVHSSPGFECLLERARRGRATREEEPHPVALQPPCCEGERRGRGGVEPLDVVERHEHPVPLGERAERVQEPHRDGVRRCGTISRHATEERDLERLELRRRQRVQLVSSDGIEHVDQRPEDEFRLGVARAR